MDQDGRQQSSGPVSGGGALRVALQAPDSYGLVLALLILSFLLAPVSEGLEWLWPRVVLQGATVLFALHTSRVRRRTMYVALAVVALSLVVGLVASITEGKDKAQGDVEILLALLLGMCVPAMLRRILTDRDVGIETIIGALDVYIIFGMFFSAVYGAIGHLSSTPFFTDTRNLTPGSYQFFSFVTLTTVGYGNLVPATAAGQSLAVMEALFGQVYLVTLVARLVSGMQPGTRRRALERLLAEREEQEKTAQSSADEPAEPSAPSLQGPRALEATGISGETGTPDSPERGP